MFVMYGKVEEETGYGLVSSFKNLHESPMVYKTKIIKEGLEAVSLNREFTVKYREFTVKFLCHRSRSTFVWPSIEDVSNFEFPQIVKILNLQTMVDVAKLFLERMLFRLAYSSYHIYRPSVVTTSTGQEYS
jgi:hypothetical protein